MSRVSDLDILRYLDGSSGEDELKSVKSWMKADKSHKKEVKDIKTIAREIPLLESFNLVDEDAEWKQFLNKTTPELTELQILHHLDGLSTYSQKKNVAAWAENNDENTRDMEVYEMIVREAPHLANYKMTNARLEWSSFETKLQQSPVAEAVSTTNGKENAAPTGRMVPMWQKLAAVAAVALFAVSVWFLRPQETYAELVTTDQGQTLEMVDGSTVELAANSKLRYPKNLKNLDERRLYLTGRGKFDVAEDATKPFIVEVNDRIGVEVIGTVFRLNDHDDYIEVVENIEGSVRAYQLANVDVDVILEAGDTFGFNGSEFVDMKEKPEVIDNAKEYDILYVLDFLMQESRWKVISSPYTEFVKDGIVMIDLDQPYEKILEDLETRADFEYEPLQCEGCFIIRKFRPIEH